MTEPVGTRSSPHGWRIGTLGGVPVYLGRSWPIILILVVMLYGPTYAARMPAVEAYLIAVAYAVLLLLSVLLHEAAHALAARWKGQRVDRVVADMWGGHTVYDATGSTPGTTALVAFVGPVTNLAIGALGWLLLPAVAPGTARMLLEGVTIVNLFVGVFNLVPGLPMDGGQIVSALVWRLTGRRSSGLIAAGWFGRVFALGLMVYFVALPLAGGAALDFSALIWTMIALFLWKGASDAIRSGPVLDATAGSVLDVLEPVVVADQRESLGSAVQRALGQPGPVIVVVVDSTGTPLGTLNAPAAQAVPLTERDRTPVSAVFTVQPESWVVRVPATATLADLVRPMVLAGLSVAAVVDTDTGRVLGVARAERLNDFIGSTIERRRRR